jgi:hypothetical protein
MKSKLARRLRWLLAGVAAVIIAAILGFLAWASIVPAPEAAALAALASDARVTVTTEKWLVFRPAGTEPDTGLVFYPGGKVDPRAYAPQARAIAEEGFLVIIVPMPLHLAVLAPDRGVEVLAAYPAVRRWAIGGHSLGGSMAAHFAHVHPGAVQGLVLWASYPAGSDDLSRADLLATSIYGTRDGLVTADKLAASRALLPPGTVWTVIDGGNHGQFGWYGPQGGDNPATISHDEQQAQTVAATLALLQMLQP